MVPVFSKAAWRCTWLLIQVWYLYHMNQEVFLNNQIPYEEKKSDWTELSLIKLLVLLIYQVFPLRLEILALVEADR